MTDISKLISEMRAGLEGVTPGPFHRTNKTSKQVCDRRGFKIARCQKKTPGPNFELSDFEVERNASHFTRCSSENIAAILDSYAQLVEAGRILLPYLEFTVGPESPGHHPTMPSAIAKFRAALKAAGALQEGGK